MKKTITCLIAAVFLFTAPAIAKAELPVKVAVDGEIMSFPDQQPRIENGRTMVPVRFVAEKMGAGVKYEAPQIIVKKGNIEIIATVSKDTVLVNREAKSLGASAIIVNDRTMVPLRFCEYLGAEVKWSDVSRIAYLFIEKKNDEQAIIKDLDEKNKITVPVAATPKAAGTIIDVSKLGKIPLLEDEPKWFQATAEQVAELKNIPMLGEIREFGGSWAYYNDREGCPAYDWVDVYFSKIPYNFVTSRDLIFSYDQPIFRGYMDFEGKGFRAVDLCILNGHIIISDPVTNTNIYDKFVPRPK